MDLLQNALLQGLTYGPAVVGIVIAFRILKYPDLTPDGSYIMGAALYGATVALTSPWVATMIAVAGGAACGVMTAILHLKAGVNRLLSGILTSMIAYSVAFRVLGGRANITLLTTRSIFDPVGRLDSAQAAVGSLGMLTVITLLIVMGLTFLLKSDLGIALRAAGTNERFLQEVGRRPGFYVTVGLAIANACVGVSAALAAARQGFADVNGGIGIVVVLIAALVFGEEIARRALRLSMRSSRARCLAGVIGSVAYFLTYLLILRASIRDWVPINVEPTDLKMLSALLIAVLYLSRRRHTQLADEILPL